MQRGGIRCQATVNGMVVEFHALIARSLFQRPHGHDRQVHLRIGVHEPGVRKILDVELKTLAQHRLAVALLGEHQPAATYTVHQVPVGHDKGMGAAAVGMADHEGGARPFAAVLKLGIDPDGVEQQFLGDGIDVHGCLNDQ